jgi:iron complex transport system permease protein
MKPGNRSFFLMVMLVAILLIVFVADLVTGSFTISISEIGRILNGSDPNGNLDFIFWNIRLPKATTAILSGAGLSLCGLMMQTLFRNPLAGPFVLGVSSGASLGVALLVMASAWFGGSFLTGSLPYGHWGLVLAAVAGSVLVMMLVILMSLRVSDSVSILIIGMMFGSATGAMVSVLQYFSDPDTVHSFLVWTFGSISGVTWIHLRLLAPLVIIGIIAGLAMQKPLNAMLLGDNHARAIGIRIRTSRIIIILTTSLLTGVITAFTGPIAFIGLAVPHLARALFRTPDHRLVTPATLLTGSILLLFCDMLSQLPSANQVLPINSVTSLIGAPVVIWVILRNRRIRNTFQS